MKREMKTNMKTTHIKKGEQVIMNNIKICERCKAALISNLDSENCDYFRHIRVKYCDSCAEIVNREKNAERCRRYRERKKRLRSAEQTKINILENENIMLHNNYIELCNTIERLKKEVEHIKGDVESIGR